MSNLCNRRRSQTFKIPSSPPESKNGSLLGTYDNLSLVNNRFIYLYVGSYAKINYLFHDMTLTSSSWAITEIIQALCLATLISQNFIVLSTEHDAKTCNNYIHKLVNSDIKIL